MNKNATPELRAKWWSANQPEGLGTAKELERALADYEAAEARFDKSGDEDDLSSCLEALGRAEAAANKAQTEAEKLAKAPAKGSKPPAKAPDELQHTVDCLKKFPKVADAARKALYGKVKATPAEADDDKAGSLSSESDYQTYLKGRLNKLRQRSMNFAIGLGKDASQHRLLFHPSKAGKSLAGAIKEQTELKRFTWGIAGAHAEKPTTLVLALEGPQAPGLKKKAERLLAYFKPMPFQAVMLMVEGGEAQDIDDPEDADDVPAAGAAAPPAPPVPPPAQGSDAATAFTARLAALLPAIQGAIAAQRPGGEAAKLKAAEAGGLVRQRNFEQANRLLDEADALLRPPPEAAAAASTGSAVTMATFTERLKGIKPALDRLIASQTAAGDEAKLRAGEAAALARQKNFEQASQVLDQLQALVDAASGGSTSSGTRGSGAPLLPIWRDAKDAVGEQISQLQTFMRDSEHPLLIRVADQGLNGITKRLQVGLQVALMEVDSAAADRKPAAAARARSALAELETFLASEPALPLLEGNPFGVAIDIRARLGGALASIRSELERVAT